MWYKNKGINFYIDSTAVIMLVFFIFAIDGIKFLIESFGKKSYYKLNNENLEKITVIIPVYNGESILPGTLRSLLKKFNRNSIIVSSNGSTDNTIEISKKFGIKWIDTKQPIGKVAAINVALKIVETEYVLIIDDDVDIKDIKIPTSALDDGASAVSFRVYPIVKNPITAIQKYEYRKSMDISRAFYNSFGVVHSISGAIGLFYKRDLIDQIGVHTEEFSGEDLQRTIIILAKNNSKILLSDQNVYTEVPETIKDLINQRIFGWNPGYISNMKTFFKMLCNKKFH